MRLRPIKTLIIGTIFGLLGALESGPQVILDGTYCEDCRPRVGGGFYEPGQTTDYLIEEGFGSRDGPNLFHSFLRFSLRDLGYRPESATFIASTHTATNPIFNVFARVTGGQRSELNGILRCTIDGANLFFVNPSGITFGPSASLDLKGSLHVSTANLLRFDDGSEWTMTAPASGEMGLVTAASPVEFGFLDGPPASVELLNTAPLRLDPGRDLSVVAGDVLIQGTNTAAVRLGGGHIEIAAAGPDVQVPVELSEFHPEAQEVGNLGTVSMSGARLEVSGTSEGAGRILIRGGRFEMQSGARVAIGAQSGSAGEILVDVHQVELSGTDTALLHRTGSSGAGGQINVAAETVVVRDGAEITSEGLGSGQGGGISILAEELELTGEGFVSTWSTSSGRGGDIGLAVDSLVVTEGGGILGITTGAGTGGDVGIAAESVLLSGGEGANTRAFIGTRTTSSDATAGGGGQLRIRADTLQVVEGGQISTTTLGAGDSGSLEILDATLVLVGGHAPLGAGPAPSGIFARSGLEVGTTATGNSGGLTVHTDVLELTDGAILSTTTYGDGDAGDLEITADERVTIAGGENGVSAMTASTYGSGSGGNLIITADLVETIDGGDVSVSTFGSGDAGGISIEADAVRVSGHTPTPVENVSGIVAQAYGRGLGGNAGGIALTVADLEVSDGALISPRAASGGRSGDIEVIATDRVLLASQGSITTDALDGTAGTIAIRGANELRLTGGGSLRAEAFETARGGAILVEDAAELIVDDGAEISSRAHAFGEAGSVSIRAEEVHLAGATITAEARDHANGGDIVLAGGTHLGLADGASVTSQVVGAGRAGSIEIRNFDTVTLSSDSSVTAEATPSGDAGIIDIDVGRSLVLTGGSQISTRAEDGAGGGVRITATDEINLLRSSITTSVTTGNEDAGSIAIDPELMVLNHSSIRANAFGGDGGSISIAARTLLQSSDSVIDASSQLGISGTITITSPDTSLTGDVVALPATFLDASALLRDSCAARTSHAGSLLVRGRDVIPSTPDAPLDSPLEIEMSCAPGAASHEQDGNDRPLCGAPD